MEFVCGRTCLHSHWSVGCEAPRQKEGVRHLGDAAQLGNGLHLPPGTVSRHHSELSWPHPTSSPAPPTVL